MNILPHKNKAKKGLKSWLALIIGLAIIISAGVIGYYHGWAKIVLDKSMSLLPVPVARVDSAFIYYRDYKKNLDALEKFYLSYQQSDLAQLPKEQDLPKIVLEDRLIKNILVQKVAGDYGIVVKSEESQAKLDEIAQNQGSQDNFAKFLKDNYGLSMADYKQYFIIPGLYYDKASQAVINDEKLNGPARQKLEEGLQKLKGGQKFEDLVKDYNELSYVQSDGTLGSLFRGDLQNKALEDQLFDMEEGEYTDIVPMPDSLQIIKLEHKNIDLGILNLKVIGVKVKTLEDLVAQKKEQAQIKIYAY